MNIDAIEVFHVALPLKSPWRTAYGEDQHIESLLVRMQSGELHAWGESTPFAVPCYSAEWAGGAFACVRDFLAPELVGKWVESGQALQELLQRFKGNPFAKAALDVTWWVLKANQQQQPLWKLLGGTKPLVEVGADFGVNDSIDQLIEQVAAAIDQGFRRVKLKCRRGSDVNVLSAIREVFPTQTFHIDCNGGYHFEDDFELLCRFDDFSLEMLEQPLPGDDLLHSARLQESISTPICLDESITSLSRAQQAIDLQACGWINIKPGRVGGLTPALAIEELCQEADIRCWVGGMLESAIGASIALALATRAGFSYPADLFPSDRFYADDLGPLHLTKNEADAPCLMASEVPGIGIEPTEEWLQSRTIAKATIHSD